MKNIHTFFNELRLNVGAIWLENSTIKLSIPQQYQNQEIKDYIVNNKSLIMSILRENLIFSKEKFLDIIIFKDNIVTYYPLSPAQERLWFIEQYEGGTNAYHIPAILEFDATTDVEGIKYAIGQVVSRHEVLRTTIEQCEEHEYGIQVVHDEPLSIEEITLSENEDYEALIKEDINRPFKLNREYPIRIKLYHIQSTNLASETSLNRTILLINIHHIASDGWSSVIFQNEVFAYYKAFLNKEKDFCLPALNIQYKDFALWQRAYLTGETLEKQLTYWRSKLHGFQTLELPVDFVRPNVIDYKGAFHKFTLDMPIFTKLKILAQRNGTTLYSVILSSFSILLSKFTGQDDIVIGNPTANRHHWQTEGLIGFFVNTQANRFLLNPTQSFEDLIKETHFDQIEAQLHQDLPFEKLVEELCVARDTSRHPIFQVLFSVQSFGSKINTSEQEKNYFKPFSLKRAYEIEKFDLSIFVDDSQEELFGYVSYASSLFLRDTIERLMNHYVQLIIQLTETPEKPYSQISLLNPEEYKRIVYDWNETASDYPKNKTICQIFQEQVKKTPSNIALTYEQQQMTYEELNEKSNQLARHIRMQYQQRANRSLNGDDLIAIYLDRSLEMVIGILAVLKAGGAYVPIDITYPHDRINYLLEDTQSELVLSMKHLAQADQTPLPQGKLISIDLTEILFQDEDSSNLPQHSGPMNIAYVIYTSGTTGKPKGVMVEHAAILSLVYNDYIQVLEKDVFAFLSSPTFDAATFEIWTPLLKGNLLVIPKDVKNLASDIKEFNDFLANYKISILWLTKALFDSLYFSDNNLFRNLNYLIIGGEALDKGIVNKLASSNVKPNNFLNGYGPTESTTFACTYNLKSQVEGCSVPIGKPINNRSTYVVDRNGSPVPIGVVGELYIGGAGLARGYLKLPDLTKERFIPNTFATDTDKASGYTRLYRTGDLVRWKPDGNLEFIGRNDDQVKIRGYRIELAEIEYAMTKISGIKQCCVLVKERNTESGSDKYLIAYYVLNSKEDSLTQTVILDKLSQMLPEYMVPSTIVMMESFPLTINGKLDKQALPLPELVNEEGHVGPGTDLEIRLCQIYADVLGLVSDQISIQQNFFRMGGNSILSIRLKQKLNQLDEFKHISIADLFKHNTINKLIQSSQQDHKTEYKLQNNISKGNNHEIAIIGVSGAFSGVSDVTELWQLIANQREGIQFYSKENCRQLGINETLLENPDYIPVTSQVKGIELFDPHFWEISPNEAKQLDPQIRKFIEHCWFALESSGYVHRRKNLNIGVFAGSSDNGYLRNHIFKGEMSEQINLWEASASNSKDALTTKTAFMLGLSGPAISINTACSTGLVTVVEASKNLQLGTCDMALAGGVSLSMPDQIGYVYQEGMISSKDGHCRTFDKDASGTTSGSGVGVILLKRLEDAIKDNDPILGVIKGYASNNDGDRKTGYTAPSVIGQSECIINAQQMARVTADQIDYVECHGTATSLGDPIEVQALREAFDYNLPKGSRIKCKTLLGAIKANIGHTNSAAGTASLIKICKMLQNSILPGQVNFNEPNPELHLNQTNFEILKENREWLHNPNKQRLAGVSSFGVGGTNAHVIIGDYIAHKQNKDITGVGSSLSMDEQRYVIPISAKNRQSLESYKQALVTYLGMANNDLSIQNISYTLQERKEHFKYRSAYCAQSTVELLSKLNADTSYAEANIEGSSKIIFMFPGQGAQYTHMAKVLYDNEQPFRDIVNQCIGIANHYLGIDFLDVIYPIKETSSYNINETQWAQLSLFTVEYALAKYLEDLGVKADAYVGHSIGEYVAATLSGVFSLEDAIKVVIARGRLMQSMQSGSMLAINAGESAIKVMVEEHGCEIAVINSLEDIVVSGNDSAIKALKSVLDNMVVPTVSLNTSHAFHSRMMEGASNEFEGIFKNIRLRKPSKHFVSNLTGEIVGEEVTTARYWCEQLRNTVQFAKGIDCLSRQNNHQVSFIEVGTGKGLSSFVNKFKNANNYQSIQTLQLLPSAKEVKTYQIIECKEDLMARLWMSGVISKPNGIKLFQHAKLAVGLPTYQFTYQKCWINKSDNIFAEANKKLIINNFTDEIHKLSILTKENVVSLLEKMLTSEKESISEDVAHREVRIMEENCSETECQIAHIIADILGIDQISIYDDFFRIGGNSIIAIKASHQISKVLGCNVKVADIFQYKTIKSLLEKIIFAKADSQGVEWEF